jgi:hypothetical protein
MSESQAFQRHSAWQRMDPDMQPTALQAPRELPLRTV